MPKSHLAPASRAQGSYAQTTLHEAAECGDLAMLRQALRAGADPRVASNEDERTPLMIAAWRGREAALDILLPLSDPKAVDESGASALMHAAHGGHMGCLKKLLPVSDPRAFNEIGESALFLAANEGRLDCLEALLPLDDPQRRNEMGWTLLMSAAHAGAMECVQRLLPLNDPRAVSLEGSTALMLASASEYRMGNAQIARLLLPLSDPLARDEAGRDALAHAASRNCLGVADALLAGPQGLDMDLANAISLAQGEPEMLDRLHRASALREARELRSGLPKSSARAGRSKASRRV